MIQRAADPFLRRLRWLTIAVVTVLFAWHALSSVRKCSHEIYAMHGNG